jgi:protein-S-isoprenylcysteine O-methyltransferase Ste14
MTDETREATGTSSRSLGELFLAVSSNRWFNISCGVGAASVFLVLLTADIVRPLDVFSTAQSDEGSVQIYAQLAALTTKVIFVCLMMTLFVFRRQPVSKAKGVLPRFVALGGTFLIFLVAVLPLPEPTLAQSVVGLTLVCLGSALSAIAISQLGGSFSIMAEARKLVTTGFYGFVRRPLYLAEEVAIIGMLVQNFSLPVLGLVIVQAGFQLWRMKNEETVLEQAFPEYGEYKASTARIIYGVY